MEIILRNKNTTILAVSTFFNFAVLLFGRLKISHTRRQKSEVQVLNLATPSFWKNEVIFCTVVVFAKVS